MVFSQRALDETAAVSRANRPYWRVYLNDENRLTPVCLQPWDENDYDQSRFLYKAAPWLNSPEKFETEEECKTWIGHFRLLLALLRP